MMNLRLWLNAKKRRKYLKMTTTRIEVSLPVRWGEEPLFRTRNFLACLSALPESFSEEQGSQYPPLCLAACKLLILEPHINSKCPTTIPSTMLLQIIVGAETVLSIFSLIPVIRISKQNPPSILQGHRGLSARRISKQNPPSILQGHRGLSARKLFLKRCDRITLKRRSSFHMT